MKAIRGRLVVGTVSALVLVGFAVTVPAPAYEQAARDGSRALVPQPGITVHDATEPGGLASVPVCVVAAAEPGSARTEWTVPRSSPESDSCVETFMEPHVLDGPRMTEC